jgi:hypothetical protein
MSEDIKKGLRPEVTREQMYAVIEHLQEAIEALIDDEVEGEEDSTETEMETESEDNGVSPIGDPEKNNVNWPVTKAYEDCGCETCKANNTSCDDCEECMSKSYNSDNEDEDKWDNIQKACWSGYKQVGMKEKNGRKVPNCVPVEKAHEAKETKEEVKKSIWGGTFSPTTIDKP